MGVAILKWGRGTGNEELADIAISSNAKSLKRKKKQNCEGEFLSMGMEEQTQNYPRKNKATHKSGGGKQPGGKGGWDSFKTFKRI